jgi:putative ATP-binding cassette transporter
MTSLSLHISLGFIRNLSQVISFSAVIWGISGALDFTVFGQHISIPGFMLWVSILYALVSSIMMEKFGRKKVTVEYEQKMKEADFRFLMMRIRENSAEIAISKGNKSERSILVHLFDGIKLNWQLIKVYTRRVAIVEQSYTEFGIILSYLLIIPRYFAKIVQIGSLMQLTMSFTNVRVGFAWFVFQYNRLTSVRSMFRRLNELDKSFTNENTDGGIVLNKSTDNTLHVSDLLLSLPNGKPLTSIGTLNIDSGSRLLIKGDSGVGKTTFMRAISGLWTFGKGTISIPEGRMLFFPQEPYLPLGNIKTALCYPEFPETFSNDDCAKVMEKCGLSQYIDSLEAEDILWSKKLSTGEKQRLAFARALLIRPDFLFLDEATSALELKMEQHLFSMLLAELPQTTIVSIAHRPSLDQYHDKILELVPFEA